MKECSICMDLAETVDCPTDKCTYQLCTQCKLKWYVENRECPACRLENGLYLGSITFKESLKQIIVIVSVYILSLAVLLLLGRLVTYIFYMSNPFWCNANDFFILAMSGSVFVLAGLLFFLLCCAACVFRWWTRRFKLSAYGSPRRYWSFSSFLCGLFCHW